MKKALALFLILAMTSSLTSVIVFANIDNPQSDGSAESVSESELESEPESEPEPEPEPQPESGLIDGSELIQTSQILPDMHVGDTITFAVAASSFNNFAGYNISGLTAVMAPGDAACFEQSFAKDANAVYLRLKALSTRAYGSIVLNVTDGAASSATFNFSVAITNPPPPPEPSSPDNDEPDDIEAPINDDENSKPDEGSSSGSSESSAAESSSSSSESSAPESSSSSSESSAPESSSSSSSSSAPESSSGESDDSSAPSAYNTIISALFPEPPPTKITTDIADIEPNGSEWIPVSGVPSVYAEPPMIVNPANSLIFAIPDNNFVPGVILPGDPFENNLAKLKNPNELYLGAITVTAPGVGNISDYFNKEFVKVGSTIAPAYGVELTPIPAKIQNAGHLLLPRGTTIGFSGVGSQYPLLSDMLIVPSNSSSGTRADGISDDSELGGQNTWVTRNGGIVGGINSIDPIQGDEYLIHFSPAFFTWSGYTPPKVTLSNIRGKISLRQSGTTNSRVFESVELASVKGEAVVRVKFRKPLATTRPIDFKTKLYLTIGGRREDSWSVDIEGSLDNVDPYEFYSEDRDIDISDGIVGIAVEHISHPRVYIGDGVTVNMLSLRKNMKFYGVASNAQDVNDDLEILELYPDILEIYNLTAIGLNGAGSTVDIDTYGNYHVYDSELNYMGNSVKKLEYSSKYYLAAKRLILPEDELEEEDYLEAEPDIPGEIPPPTGGDYPGSTTPYNPYDNPATGR